MSIGILPICLIAGFVCALFIGDPPNKYHPLSWFGSLVNIIIPKFKSRTTDDSFLEKLNGIIFLLFIIVIFSLVTYYLAIYSYIVFGLVGFAFYSILSVKFSIAISTMEEHVNIITDSLKKNNIEKARNSLSYIVSRDTKSLDQEHIISGTIESIAESTVDGIISPIFYFSIFGPIGAIVCRIINTLDSMIGYTDKYYYHIGWMTAKTDTVMNYIPSRICAILIVFSARIVGADSKNSIRILREQCRNTASINAGYPISAMAGALRIKLEKIGQYEIGLAIDSLSVKKFQIAISIMKISAVLFCIIVSIPIMVLLSLVEWWKLLFGI
jgi:adenosylcobinamide-phosphate synthase